MAEWNSSRRNMDYHSDSSEERHIGETVKTLIIDTGHHENTYPYEVCDEFIVLVL